MPGVDIPPSSPQSAKPAREIRSLPQVFPSERLKVGQLSRMQVDVPERRKTLGETLRASTTRIVVESSNRDAWWERKPEGSRVTPEVVLDAIWKDQCGEYHLFAATQKVVNIYDDKNALQDVLEKDPELLHLRRLVFHHLLVEIGVAMMDRTPGPHFTFIDPSCATMQNNDDQGSGVNEPATHTSRVEKTVHEVVEHAKELHTVFLAAGVESNRVIIGIPATEPGVLAAAILQGQYNICTDLYLISGVIHAAACAEARPTCITIDVAAVMAWYERDALTSFPTNRKSEPFSTLINHPGVIAIQSILRYYKLYAIKTTIIGRNFRTIYEVSLFGSEFGAVSLSHGILERLYQTHLPLHVPGFAEETFLDHRDLDSETLAISMDSTASHVASAAPKFPTVMLSHELRHMDGSKTFQPNFNWFHSQTFRNPSFAISESFPFTPIRPIIPLASITLNAVGRMKVQIKKLRDAVEESARYRVELRVLTLEELYAKRRARGIWDDVSRLGFEVPTPPASPEPEPEPRKMGMSVNSSNSSSASLQRQSTLQELGKGFLSSTRDPIAIHSPSPRRPSSRGSLPHTVTTPSRRRPSSLKRRTSSQNAAAPGGYASNEEVEKIIVLTFGAHLLGNPSVKQIPEVETDMARIITQTFGEESSPALLDAIKNEPKRFLGGITSSSSSSHLTSISSNEGSGINSEGQRQVLTLNALSRDKEETKRREAKEKERLQDSQLLVEGVDFF